MMLTRDSADSFARSWCDAWNRHDLDAIMRHYADEIGHTSPLVTRVYPDRKVPSLHGVTEVREYFRVALMRNPDLSFQLRYVAIGVESVVLIYDRSGERTAAEVLVLNEDRRIIRSMSHYAP